MSQSSKQQKSILFLIPTLGGGGAERVLTNLANNLNPNKYDITIQTLFRGGINSKYLNRNIKFLEGSVNQFPGNVLLLKLFSPRLLYRIWIKKRYDIVVSYLEGPTARIVAGCPFVNSKLVSWIHVEQLTLTAATYCYRSEKEARWCNSRYHATVCVAESVKEDFLKFFPETKNCMVLYNTNEDDKVKTLAQKEVDDLEFPTDVIVVSVGRLTEAKGYDRLLRVHMRLIAEGVKHQIFILGDGIDKEKLETQIRELGIQDTFHLLGFKENPYKYVSKADLFVCSSRREGFSTAVTEAMILGIPIVTTNCSGSYELCGHNNEYGIVITNDENGIYEGFKRMLSDKSVLSHYKEKAIERGLTFSKNETVKAVETMFDNL